MGVVEVDLRAGMIGGEAGLALDVAVLEVDRLLPELDEAAERLVVALEIGKIGADALEPALRLAQGELEGHRINLEQRVASGDVLTFPHEHAADLTGNIRR